MLARRGENVYTDPSLLDVAGTMEALPELGLDDGRRSDGVTAPTAVQRERW